MIKTILIGLAVFIFIAACVKGYLERRIDGGAKPSKGRKFRLFPKL